MYRCVYAISLKVYKPTLSFRCLNKVKVVRKNHSWITIQRSFSIPCHVDSTSVCVLMKNIKTVRFLNRRLLNLYKSVRLVQSQTESTRFIDDDYDLPSLDTLRTWYVPM